MTVVLISFAAYTLGIVAIGLYSARYASRSDEDFFLAGRSLGPTVAALSSTASSESGWVTLGLVGWAYSYGVQAYWIIPGCLCGYLFNWFFLAARMSDRSRQLNALTLPDFFAFHYRERVPVLRSLTVLVILVAMLLYVAAQLAAAGKAFSTAFPGVEYQAGVLIGATVVLVYTVTGGFRAVCWTDFLQALLMIGTLVIFPVYLLLSHGGYGPVFDTLRDVAPKEGNPGEFLRFIPNATGLALLGFLLGHGALGINFGYPGQPHVLVRFMALRDRREARIAGVIAFVWGLCVYWGAVTIGLFARTMAERGAEWTAKLAADGEISLVVSAMELLPGVLSGMVLAAVLAAICSTADSQLVVAASSAANDLYARLVRRGEPGNHPWVNRAVVAGLGIIAVLLVIDEEVKVYEFVLTYGWALLGASFGPQVILALLWKRSSYIGCIGGMLAGFLVAVVWPEIYDEEATGVHVYNLTLGFAIAMLVNVVLSLLIPSKSAPATRDESGQ